MIIGIYGQSGAGKDTLAEIINLLYYNSSLDTLPLVVNEETIKVKYSDGWKKVGFADAVKQRVSIMTSLSLDTLNDSKVKDEFYIDLETGEGLFESEIKKLNLVEENLDEIKRINNVSNLKADLISMSNNSSVIWKIRYFVQVNTLLQYEGTDIGRNQFNQNIWVNILKRRYTPNLKWIITDCRFENEVKFIKERGILLQIKRNKVTGKKDRSHQSEDLAIKDVYADFIFDNNGSIEDLYNIVSKDYISMEKLLNIRNERFIKLQK